MIGTSFVGGGVVSFGGGSGGSSRELYMHNNVGVTWHEMACRLIACLCLVVAVAPETAEALFCLVMKVSIVGNG